MNYQQFVSAVEGRIFWAVSETSVTWPDCKEHFKIVSGSAHRACVGDFGIAELFKNAAKNCVQTDSCRGECRTSRTDSTCVRVGFGDCILCAAGCQ